jgi:hypothetical protein
MAEQRPQLQHFNFQWTTTKQVSPVYVVYFYPPSLYQEGVALLEKRILSNHYSNAAFTVCGGLVSHHQALNCRSGAFV